MFYFIKKKKSDLLKQNQSTFIEFDFFIFDTNHYQ